MFSAFLFSSSLGRWARCSKNHKAAVMKNLHIILTIFICFILSCSSEPGNPQRKIETRIFRNDTIPSSNLSGFGYDILVDGKLYIHQPHIPAVSGSVGFMSEQDARKTAEYVSEKLRNTNTLPALSKQELDRLGIKY